MKLYGKLVKDTKILNEALVEIDNENASFRDLLEECLINLCKELDIQVPLWFKKNTTEFITFRKTSFAEEQFMESINFDRFELRIV